jgi:adenine specific DNA methylase Mod
MLVDAALTFLPGGLGLGSGCVPPAVASVNKLYFGDNLDILREYVPDQSIDLIYLDPPFNSQAHYNVLFQSPKTDAESAQVQAFRDMWSWGDEAEWAFKEVMRQGASTARFIDALRSALKESDMMAYLVMMAVRLHELHRKLKSTGSIYLHCDPTASHYLKIVMDGIFGADNFLNEVIWKRTSAHSSAKRYGPVHDVILFYGNGKGHAWNQVFQPYDSTYLDAFYTHYDEDDRRWRRSDLTGAGTRRGETGKPWRGINVTAKGRHWAWPPSELDRMDAAGKIHWPEKEGGMPMLKRYLDEQPGLPLQDVIADIPPMHNLSDERIGYPTQKPLTLLDRLIRASSNKGEVILDPFCGCGTTIEAAQRAGRQWIGIDVAVHAIKVIEARISDRLGPKIKYQIEGMPRDFESAVKLADRDKYQFQWWANYLFNPHALREQKKGADRGIDGELFFPNGPGRPWGRTLTSVKGGEHTGPNDVRAFARVLDREKAELGLFICLYPPTREMIREAASVGLADVVHGDIPKLQIVSIEDWFKGKMPLLPPLEHLPSAAFSGRRRPTQRAATPDAEQPELPFTFVGGKRDKSITRHFNPRMVGGRAG